MLLKASPPLLGANLGNTNQSGVELTPLHYIIAVYTVSL
jgi:hypothetical protein